MLRALALVLALFLTAFRADAVEVIANRDVATRSLSLSQARAIFGMRQPQWPDGKAVRVFVLADLNPVHAAFCKENLNLFPYQLRQSWDRLVYSGIGQAPTEVGSEDEMIVQVASTPGAIGYVRKVIRNDPVITISIH
jgi:ABC-type phosphate transport system substrate-binding protein